MTENAVLFRQATKEEIDFYFKKGIGDCQTWDDAVFKISGIK